MPDPADFDAFHILYRPGADMSAWRLASDMYDNAKPGGYSVHGDWFNGWDPEISSTWLGGCVRRPVSCGSHMLGDGRVRQGSA